MTDIVIVPAAPVVPPFPALGDSAFNQKAYDWGVALPGVSGEVQDIAVTAHTNATVASEKAAAAVATAAQSVTSASEALASKNSAAASAGEALASKSVAALSAGAAEASRIAASKLNLGAKSAPPALDNQGETLLASATYYDTTLNKWRVWTGAAWGDGISAVAGVSSINGDVGDVAGLLKVTGDAMTGKLSGTAVSMANFLDKTVTNAVATGATALDLAQGDVFDLTLTGAATLSLIDIPALTNETLGFVVRVTQGATAYALTWFAGIAWLTTGGSAPDAPAANKTSEYVFTTRDGATFQGRKGAST